MKGRAIDSRDAIAPSERRPHVGGLHIKFARRLKRVGILQSNYISWKSYFEIINGEAPGSASVALCGPKRRYGTTSRSRRSAWSVQAPRSRRTRGRGVYPAGLVSGPMSLPVSHLGPLPGQAWRTPATPARPRAALHPMKG